VAAVLLASLPAANNVFVIATRYEVRPGRISTVIFATTLLALGSFNLWAWLLRAHPAG
jgi:predicted permease